MDAEQLEQARDVQFATAEALRRGNLYDYAHSDDRYEETESDRDSERVEAARLTP